MNMKEELEKLKKQVKDGKIPDLGKAFEALNKLLGTIGAGHKRGRQEVVELIPDIMNALRDSHRVILFCEKELEGRMPGEMATQGVIMANQSFIEEVIGKLLENVPPSFVFKAWLRKLRPSVKKREAASDAKEKERAARKKADRDADNAGVGERDGDEIGQRSLGGITAAAVAEELGHKGQTPKEGT